MLPMKSVFINVKTGMSELGAWLAVKHITPDDLKAKKISTNAVKKLEFVIMYVPDRYKNQ